jgi:hypothetical protein
MRIKLTFGVFSSHYYNAVIHLFMPFLYDTTVAETLRKQRPPTNPGHLVLSAAKRGYNIVVLMMSVYGSRYLTQSFLLSCVHICNALIRQMPPEANRTAIVEFCLEALETSRPWFAECNHLQEIFLTVAQDAGVTNIPEVPIERLTKLTGNIDLKDTASTMRSKAAKSIHSEGGLAWMGGMLLFVESYGQPVTRIEKNLSPTFATRWEDEWRLAAESGLKPPVGESSDEDEEDDDDDGSDEEMDDALNARSTRAARGQEASAQPQGRKFMAIDMILNTDSGK